MAEEFELNGEAPKPNILRKFGINEDDLPEDAEAMILLIRSPSKGTNACGSINDRVISSGLLYFALEHMLPNLWAQQDAARARAEMQERMLKQHIQQQILNPSKE